MPDTAQMCAAPKKTVDEHNANSGSMVVIDPESFEILAMSNYPSFDPNDRKKITIGTLENKAATDLFEPGSTDKPIIMAAVLQKFFKIVF
mgnify:CR=1 FL=1